MVSREVTIDAQYYVQRIGAIEAASLIIDS